MAHFTKLTPKKQSRFLDVLRETGNVSRACEAIGVSRTSVYNLKAGDGEFAEKWQEAHEFAMDMLEEEARRRAYDGVDEPVFYKGDECGAVRKYSDTLMIFLLKGGRPEKYRENTRMELTGKDGGPVEIDFNKMPREYVQALAEGLPVPREIIEAARKSKA